MTTVLDTCLLPLGGQVAETTGNKVNGDVTDVSSQPSGSAHEAGQGPSNVLSPKPFHRHTSADRIVQTPPSLPKRRSADAILTQQWLNLDAEDSEDTDGEVEDHDLATAKPIFDQTDKTNEDLNYAYNIRVSAEAPRTEESADIQADVSTQVTQVQRPTEATTHTSPAWVNRHSYQNPLQQQQVTIPVGPALVAQRMPKVLDYAWRLRTTGLDVPSQPSTTSTMTDSPATPTSTGLSAVSGSQPFSFSHSRSASDLSYLDMSELSTDSRDEFTSDVASLVGDEFPAQHGGVGVPPPRPKKSHARKQPADHIKRARNAFILFRKHITDSNLIPPSVEIKHQNISVVVAKMWREAPQDVRQHFQQQARKEKEEHQRKYPGYRYQPVFRRNDIVRRRVRKDPAEDDKVEAVAEALIKGKAGDALEREIKEQMTVKSEAGESDGDGDSSTRSKSRLRRHSGELSKGAMRARRAQVRAKQQRHHLLGADLLNASMYNAQLQRMQRGEATYLPPDYVPVGYGVEGRPIVPTHQSHGYPNAPGHGLYLPPPEGMLGMMESDNGFSLPPIQSYDDRWEERERYYGDVPMGDQYTAMDHQIPYDASHPGEAYYHGQIAGPSYQSHYPYHHDEYRLAPLPLLAHSTTAGADDPLSAIPGPSHGPVDETHHEPSRHVMFNERLFDGALGSAGLNGMYDDA